MNEIELIRFFTWHPERIAAVSGVFFLGYFGMRLLRHKFPSVRTLPLLITALVWGLFAIWEMFCEMQQANIRADLFLIYPTLLIVGAFGLSISIGSALVSPLKRKVCSMSNGES